jgi:nitrite reductase/ring-hydroxylating ferredoxin subunit
LKHFIGKTSEFPDNQSRKVAAGKKRILVWKTGNRFFATSERCPHQGAPLGTVELTGTMLPSAPKQFVYGLEGSVIQCPWHAWEFDVRTGRRIFGEDERCLATYEILVENDDVYINI